MNKLFWSCMIFLMSILVADAQEFKINKLKATAKGSCGETCNPIEWEARFNLLNKAGKEIEGPFAWSLIVNVFCETLIESTSTGAFDNRVAMGHNGEICKHPGNFLVVSKVKATDHRGRILAEEDFRHTPP